MRTMKGMPPQMQPSFGGPGYGAPQQGAPNGAQQFSFVAQGAPLGQQPPPQMQQQMPPQQQQQMPPQQQMQPPQQQQPRMQMPPQMQAPQGTQQVRSRLPTLLPSGPGGVEPPCGRAVNSIGILSQKRVAYLPFPFFAPFLGRIQDVINISRSRGWIHAWGRRLASEP